MIPKQTKTRFRQEAWVWVDKRLLCKPQLHFSVLRIDLQRSIAACGNADSWRCTTSSATTDSRLHKLEHADTVFVPAQNLDSLSDPLLIDPAQCTSVTLSDMLVLDCTQDSGGSTVPTNPKRMIDKQAQSMLSFQRLAPNIQNLPTTVLNESNKSCALSA